MIEDEQLTEWTRPTEMMDTFYGRISYRDWCNREAARISRETGRQVYLKEGGGKEEDKVCIYETKKK